MFETNQKESFPAREERILAFWQAEEIFQKSLSSREKGSLYSFYDGPPFATGLPHYGHILAGTIKDVIPRYKTMQGYYVPRRFGWDCHGLPVEMEIEKGQNLSGAPEIEAFGIGKFNEACRSIVLRYTEEWKSTVNRMGRWVDFSQTFKTMDSSFMESVWWVFYELYAKGLVYEGFKVMPFSAKLGTPLSNFEANLNYRDVDDPSLTVTFPLSSDPETFLLAWTTTPWTLPSNLAVAVHPDMEYVKIKKNGQYYILAEARLGAYCKDPSEYEIVEKMAGKSLIGKHYEPLFSYFAHKRQEQAFKVLAGDFVSTEDGTGIVHAAPAFGEADFFVCAANGIELVCPVDHNGKFTKEIPELVGMFVKDADKEIIKMLKAKGRVFEHTQIRHRYPFCWRSDTPLIYRAVRTWFVAVEKIKDKIMKNNDEILWVPDHIKYGRFGKWLENARDWAISRNRYWGTPIPIWRSSDGEIIVIGSIAELEERTGKKVSDIHRHFIDDLTFEENGKVFKRVPEVFDCWFESGSMPYAQNHYPFENQEETIEGFPADFVAEGIDQTRCWFYTLNIISTALFNRPAFKNVIVNGIILAEDGNKMSKRLKNYPEPEKVINEYGADAIRLFLLSSGAIMADDCRFSEKGVEQIMRGVLIPLWNSYLFLATYASIYKWTPPQKFAPPKSDIDRWILSLLQKLVLDVTTSLDRYELGGAVTPFITFIDALTNWYIRRSRSRFWADEDTPDRRQAFATLYQVLMTLAKVAAPFTPFITDAIYQQLKTDSDLESVHLHAFPKANLALRDENLEMEMEATQIVVSNAHALRKEQKLKVRQPLKKAHVIVADENLLASLQRQENLIAEELNVHQVAFSSNETDFVTLSCKPNFRVLGKKVGGKMRAVQEKIGKLTQKQKEVLLSGNPLEIDVEGEAIVLTPEDVAVEREVQSGLVARTEKGITVALDTALSEELILEGIARELINKINTMRRDGGFYVTDRIMMTLQTTDRVVQVFKVHKEFIMHEVLAVDVKFGPCEGTEWDINGEKTVISLQVVSV